MLHGTSLLEEAKSTSYSPLREFRFPRGELLVTSPRSARCYIKLGVPAADIVAVCDIDHRGGKFKATRQGTTWNATVRSGDIASELRIQQAPPTIDISSLPVSFWGPVAAKLSSDGEQSWAGLYIRRAAYSRRGRTRPPGSHQRAIGGIFPLPGLARFGGTRSHAKTLLIVSLGFDGSRSAYVKAEYNFATRLAALLSSPGYKPNYTQEAAIRNGDYINHVSSRGAVWLSRPDSPFDTARQLHRIIRKECADYTYIAPLGTRPAALGAILYAERHRRSCEIVYDHPPSLLEPWASAQELVRYEF